MQRVAIYLRKSREDEKLEKELGKGETLSLHRRDLLKYAKIHKLEVVKIHEELVSGESLLYRPAMLELLKEVEQGMYDGVLCMDMQRLGRGDMEEQGIILKAFKKSCTKIITLDKTYDLDNEFDEEYSEFEAFMSRKEYKMINKRLRRGVMRSVEAGNYNSPWRPFGYEIKELNNGRTLEINEAEANIIKLIYSWYIDEPVGSTIISERLNSMNIKTIKGNKWSAYSVVEIIKNPIYTGKIAYNRRYGYRSSNKKKAAKNRPSEEWLIYEGKHEAIISQEIYDRAMTIMSTYRKSPNKPGAEFVNPLAGLIICGVCGAKMVQRTYNSAGVLPHIMCRQKCGNKSSKLIHIENAVLSQVKLLLTNKRIESAKADKNNDFNKDRYEFKVKTLERQLEDLKKQKENAYDFLEKGIYTIEVFNERLSILNEKMLKLEKTLDKTKGEFKEASMISNPEFAVQIIESVLDAYESATSDEKNMLLKSIIEKAVYTKDPKAREDNFTLELVSRI